jgi:hypothetical protein
MTPDLVNKVSGADASAALKRHAAGDWGDIEDYYRKANEIAVKNGEVILSSYKSSNGIVFWIMTKASRRVTKIFLPEER